jgi:hypothetical protein
MRIELATNKMVRPKGCLVMIDNTLSRLFKGLPQLPVKWRAFIRNNELHVYHYHHLVIIYDLKTKIYKHTWWELPADKRGLESCKIWLRENNK